MFDPKKLKKHYEWPFFNERVHYIKEITGKDMSIERLHEILEADALYFTIDFILSKHINTSIKNIISKSYKWKKMKDCFNTTGEQLYVWMYKIGKGEFKNIEFGTIQELEASISRNINNKISKL